MQCKSPLRARHTSNSGLLCQIWVFRESQGLFQRVRGQVSPFGQKIDIAIGLIYISHFPSPLRQLFVRWQDITIQILPIWSNFPFTVRQSRQITNYQDYQVSQLTNDHSQMFAETRPRCTTKGNETPELCSLGVWLLTIGWMDEFISDLRRWVRCPFLSE